MMERRRIVELWKRTRPAVLVTLVRVTGSSYRREGARLLIAADGSYAGSISGGCLEAEVLRKALWLTRDGAVVQQYSTLFDDTADVPYGLGCGGTVDLLLEPAETAECRELLNAMERSLAGEAIECLTQLPAAGVPLQRFLQSNGVAVFCSPEFDRGQPGFNEVLHPPQRLLVCGAADDAQPVVRLAAALGWTVTVLDGRAQWARSERFPEAAIVAASSTLGAVSLGPQDAVVIMTHSFEQDREWLTQVLPARPRYLGLLGARHRSALLVAEAAGRLQWQLDRACAGVFAPVGLDLGGDGAEAIALAVIAEIQACVQGKLGHSRRLTPQIVEQQIAVGGPTQYLQTQCAV